MRIALVSGWDTADPRAWSGVLVPMLRALERDCAVDAVRVPPSHHVVDRGLARAHGLLGRPYLPEHAVASAWRRGSWLRHALAQRDVDAVLAVAVSSAVALSGLRLPVVQVTDATFTAVTDYYPMYRGLGPVVRGQAQWLERRAQRASDSVIVTSRWARTSFTRDYGYPAERVTVAPFGPAITPTGPVPGRTTTRGAAAPRVTAPGTTTLGVPLRILLVASDWHRKDGDRAVAAVDRLRASGVPASLTVVGRAPEGLPGWVRRLGTLSAEEMSAVYTEQDVLLELSRANAGGVTLTDAAAHGLPVIAADTGGVPDIVVHGESGLLVRTGADEDRALLCVSDPVQRQRLATGALARHRELLNWDAWADHVLAVLSAVTRVGEGRAGERGAGEYRTDGSRAGGQRPGGREVRA